MLSNLIGNAIKYSGEKPCRITIRGAVSPKETVLSVTDEGIGISEANVKRIFDKFYRVPNGNLHDVKGFGMAELIIRIKALLNKISVRKEESSNFTLGQYTFDSITQTLQYCGEKQLLSNRESEILKRLCENKDHVLPMKDVLLELWGDDSFFNARSLHVFITKLRHKLSKDESIKILNVRGIGYKLIID